MRVDQTRLRNEIKNYLNYNIVKKTLSIDWDSLCIHILKQYGRMFSPVELERASIPEFKKLEGFPVGAEMFEEIARYIDEMTVYMHQQGMRLGEERDDGMKARFEKYREDLQRSKRNKK